MLRIAEVPESVSIGVEILYRHPVHKTELRGRVQGRHMESFRVRDGVGMAIVPYADYICSLYASSKIREHLPSIRKRVLARFPAGYYNEAAIERFVLLAVEIWEMCEKAYGLSELGSVTDEQLQKLAFMILSGDPLSCDMARDILRI